MSRKQLPVPAVKQLPAKPAERPLPPDVVEDMAALDQAAQRGRTRREAVEALGVVEASSERFLDVGDYETNILTSDDR